MTEMLDGIDWAGPDDPECEAMDGWCCTRVAGHQGDHIATCTTANEAQVLCHRWPQGESE
jgi:hypothetical protein